jgi:ABC-type multidrug transport system permease subunit
MDGESAVREPGSSGSPEVIPSAVHPAGRRRAAGIYGTVITAAVLASAGGHLATTALAIAVLMTLVVYWIAEQYAEVLAEETEHGHLPTWSKIRSGMANTWPMVTAAYIPVLGLVVARLFGASQIAAANIALFIAMALLAIHGWTAGRAAGLHGSRLLIATLLAGCLGLMMIILKNFVITNLH